MAVTSNRQIQMSFAGDVLAPNLAYAAAANATSPGDIDVQTLASGANTITPPAGAKGATLIFPSGNTVLVTLKGVTGDTGVALHKTDPTSIGLDSPSNTFCLNAASSLVGFRIIWT